ncbi:MAG: RNA polymerase sigma factor [Patescibacteria group bacterium]
MTLSVNLSDEQLVIEIRERDKELYGEIIRRYQTKLTHYLRKFIRNGDELEDVLQEVFIKAYRNLFDFNADKRFSPWIYRIAHNEALNHIKKYKRESFSLDDQEWEIMDESIDLKKDIDNNILKKRIEDGLASIKDKYREPLILFLLEQKSYEEISEILRLPRNTVGTLVMRGKKILREYLVKHSYGK